MQEPKSTFNFSFPTKTQFVHGVERTLVIFVVAVAVYIKLHVGTVGSEVWSGAGYAGVAAVYQFVLSTLTNL